MGSTLFQRPACDPDQLERARRALCRSLGAKALATAPVAHHDKWLHDAGTPPQTPTLPVGNLWNLINNIKVMHQYTELISESASGGGVHAPALFGGIEACTNGLDWMGPLLSPIHPCSDKYQQHIDLWRASNPGLYSYAEAAYNVHQSYVVEDRNMTRLLVSNLLPSAKEYEVSIAASLLRARPDSFDEFQSSFLGWRSHGVYHALELAARHLPSAEQWVSDETMHEAEDWQALLDEFNKPERAALVTPGRLASFCDRMIDRSPKFCNQVCGILDRVCVLVRVKSNAAGSCVGSKLDSLLPTLIFDSEAPGSQRSPYTHSLLTWGRLKQSLESALPPALLCPSLGTSNRDGWGYPRLDLGVCEDRLMICTGSLQWLKKGEYPLLNVDTGFEADRFQDILLRMSECATCPEVAHLMLDPASFSECLAGRADSVSCDTALFTNRQRVLDTMDPALTGPNDAFIECIKRLVDCLPAIRPQTLPTPLSVLAWRVDCPPRAILYDGLVTDLDLERCAPHLLPKSLLPDKMTNKTISGVCILSDTEDSYNSIRACVAKEILSQHADFSEHPFHKVRVASHRKARRGRRNEDGVAHTTTTLAESVSLFTAKMPHNHKEVELHASEPWNSDDIDDRYAETQKASNGLRYRDWVTMYRDMDSLQRSRLATHHVFADQLFHTHFPVTRADGTYGWISVASTLPAETRVLRNIGGNTPLESLKRSVENRFFNDTKLLPVWHPGDSIDPIDVEFYTDQSANQVAIVYAPRAPDGSRRRLELISFRAH